MIQATDRELENVGITDRPNVIVADAGYWHHEQIDKIVVRGMQVLIRPDAKKRKGARAGWTGGAHAWMRTLLANKPGRRLYNQRSVNDRARVRGRKHNRKIDRFQRTGRAAVSSEWRLINATHNLLNCTATGSRPPPGEIRIQRRDALRITRRIKPVRHRPYRT
jgi:hypothetical protein